MTNNEKINAMSVEEKAEFFKNICPQIAIFLGNKYVARDKKSITEWLNSEVEE